MPVYDKTVETRIFGVTVQNSTNNRMPIGDSTGGAFTALADNPLRGTIMWDHCMYILEDVVVAGGATGGSYTITIETDKLLGITALPIAQVTGVGPNSPNTLAMDSLHQSPASPIPTHVTITQDLTGGGLNFQCHVFAKQYRGFMGSPAVGTAERVILGDMIVGTSAGGAVHPVDDRGLIDDTTLVIGTSSSDLGMHNMRLWDTALYWVVAGNTIDGTHDVDIVSTIDGATFTVATTGIAGALNVADEKLALVNSFYGQSPNPSAIIWTEVTSGGVSDPRIIVMAKSGRGSMAKR